MNNYAYLIYVDGLKNSNKFYEIKENSDSSIDVTYGRVGVSQNHHHYKPYEKTFEGLKSSKISKGYEDVTALHSIPEQSHNNDLDYCPIEDEEINGFVNMLIKSAKEFMEKNYTVKAAEITPKMVQEAENDIKELCYIAENSLNALPIFNEKLRELFIDIPRVMTEVSAHFAKTSADFSKIIQREQEMLDNIKGQVKEQTKSENKDSTVLEAYGLKVTPITYKEEDQIIAHMGYDYNNNSNGERRLMEDRYVTSYKVENIETRKKYEDFKINHSMTNKDVRLFYHGSRTENWWSIMKQGLSLNPNAQITGKMFGNGLYFAPDFRKSSNYTSARGSYYTNGNDTHGYVAIYAVSLGKCYKPHNALGSHFNYDDLKDGCLSVYADKKLTGLKNDEYVIYKPEQCTIKYIVEITGTNAREKNYTLNRNCLRNYLSDGIDKLVRTENGLRTELNINDLSDKCQNEIINKIVSANNANRIYLDYNIVNDRIEVFCEDSYGDEHIEVNLTYDDKAFLCREMKKCFAESESEWKSKLRDFAKEKTNTVLMSNINKQTDESEKTSRKDKGNER